MKISLSSIKTDGGTQSREKLNEDVMSDYSELMKEGVVFPPVVLFYDGSVYWMADGFHRHGACVLAGLTEIDADVKQGERRDAILFSVGANATHGLRG